MKKSFKIPIYNQHITISSAMPDKYKNDYRAIFVYDEWTLYYQPEFWGVEMESMLLNSNSQRYKMLGNGWTVDVIAHLLKGLK